MIAVCWCTRTMLYGEIKRIRCVESASVSTLKIKEFTMEIPNDFFVLENLLSNAYQRVLSSCIYIKYYPTISRYVVSIGILYTFGEHY